MTADGMVSVVGAFSINLLWCNGLLSVALLDGLFEFVLESGCKGGIEPICVSMELLLLCWCWGCCKI